jgi:hypothetical protein
MTLVIDELLNTASKMYGFISKAGHNNFLQTVKLDHIVWKNEVCAYLRRESGKTIDSFASHLQSRLGKWYYEGDGKAQYSQFTDFRNIEAPHAAVHESGLSALRALKTAKQLNYDSMETVSSRVIQLLAEMEVFKLNKVLMYQRKNLVMNCFKGLQ